MAKLRKTGRAVKYLIMTEYLKATYRVTEHECKYCEYIIVSRLSQMSHVDNGSHTNELIKNKMTGQIYNLYL